MLKKTNTIKILPIIVIVITNKYDNNIIIIIVWSQIIAHT